VVAIEAPRNQRRQVFVWHASSLDKVSLCSGQRHSLRSEDTEGYRGATLRVLRLVDVAAAFLAKKRWIWKRPPIRVPAAIWFFGSCLRKAKGSWAE